MVTSAAFSTEVVSAAITSWHHHRLVHEEAWRVVRVGDEVHVIPPEWLQTIFTRGPDVRWAA